MDATQIFRDDASPRQKRRWGRRASLAAVSLGAVGGFLAVTRTIENSSGNAFDRAVMTAFGRARHPVSNAVARGLTFFGSVIAGATIATSTVVALRRRPRIATQVAVGALGGTVAELLVKRFFRRERPRLLEHLERVKSSSFPSGHSMAAASLYLTLGFVASRGRESKKHRAVILAAASAFAASIGATRVFLGVHWPTDVLGGLALGTAWACGTEGAIDFRDARVRF